jgi:hypothetical protein
LLLGHAIKGLQGAIAKTAINIYRDASRNIMRKSEATKYYWLALVGYYFLLGLIVLILYVTKIQLFAVAAISLFYVLLTKITEQILFLNLPGDTLKEFFRTFPINAVIGIFATTSVLAVYCSVEGASPLTTALLITASAYGLEKILLYYVLKRIK